MSNGRKTFPSAPPRSEKQARRVRQELVQASTHMMTDKASKYPALGCNDAVLHPDAGDQARWTEMHRQALKATIVGLFEARLKESDRDPDNPRWDVCDQALIVFAWNARQTVAMLADLEVV